MSSIQLSIIIPAYNEELRILPYLREIADYFDRRETNWEALVVNDGSTDATSKVVTEFHYQHPEIRLVNLPHNGGKGAAVRHGMLQAKGELCLFTDADGSTPISELERFEKAIGQGADVVIGSRALAALDPQYRLQTLWHRTTLGNLFNRCVQRLGIPGIHDTQCGFKLFRKEVADDLFSVARIAGFGFDLELLFVARLRQYRIAELPVNWSERSGSKVRVLRDGIAMFGELFKIRRNHGEGLYEKPPSSRHVL